MTLTHAITQPQPLAWAQASGHCPVILSDTRPDFARVGELLGIHAHTTRRQCGAVLDGILGALSLSGVALTTVPTPADLAHGALVGVVRLVGVIRAARVNEPLGTFRVLQGSAISTQIPADLAARIRPWWRSGTKWGLLLGEAVLLSEPIPMRGSGGVWRIQGSFSGPSYDEELGAFPMTHAAWALEQWRKARGAP